MKSMLSHLSLGVRDLEISSRFYDAIFEPLGYVRIWATENGAGYGREGKPDEFAIFHETETTEKLSAGPGFHLAFNAPNRDAVNSFYRLAISHGANGQHPPRDWPEYSPTYYAAFLWDRDGHRLEAVHQ